MIPTLLSYWYVKMLLSMIAVVVFVLLVSYLEPRTDMFKDLGVRDVIALIIMALFSWVFIHSTATPGYEETLKNIVLIVAGFYLGGSKVGSDTATENAKTVSRAAKTPAPTMENPQEVTVVNPPEDPVQVEIPKD